MSRGCVRWRTDVGRRRVAAIGHEQGLRNLGDQIDRPTRQGWWREAGGGGGGSRVVGSPAPSSPAPHRHGLSVIVVVALLAVAASYGYARYRFDQLKGRRLESDPLYGGRSTCW